MNSTFPNRNVANDEEGAANVHVQPNSYLGGVSQSYRNVGVNGRHTHSMSGPQGPGQAVSPYDKMRNSYQSPTNNMKSINMNSTNGF